MKWLNFRNVFLLALLLTLGLVLTLLKPFAETEIKKMIASKVVTIQAIRDFELKDLKVGLLPPSVEFKSVSFLLTDQPELKRIKVQRLKIYPEIIRLLSFEFKLKNIYAKGLNLEFENATKKPEPLQIKFNYSTLTSLPVKSVYIEDSKVKYNSDYLDIGYFSFKRKWNRFEVHSDLNTVRFFDSTPDIKVNRLSLVIQKDKTKLQQLSMLSKDSNLQLGFEINKPFNEKLLKLNFVESTDIRMTSRLNLENFKFLIEKHLDKKVKKLSGQAQILVYKSARNKKKELEFTVEAENLNYDNFFVKNLSTNGIADINRIKVNAIKIKNDDLVLKSKKLILKKNGGSYSLSFNGDVESFEVGGFLSNNVGTGTVPVNLPSKFTYRCFGLVHPSLGLKCDVSGSLGKLHIWGDSKRKKQTTILKLSPSKVEGQAYLENEKMSFNSFHEFESSQVAFEGEVDYVKGFNVEYVSDFFNFSDVESLANIPVKGFGNVKGTTSGSLMGGVIDLKADMSNFSFFKYNFGQVVGDFRYEKQNLLFQNLRSAIGESLIKADISFDLKNNFIKTVANSKQITIKDLLFAVKDIAVPPVYLSGDGKLDIVAEGPLDLGQMTYDIAGEFNEGLIYKDRYRDLKISVKAVRGQVTTENSLTYLGDKINIQGSADPNGIVDIIAMGDSLNLSRIKAVKDLGVQVSGLAQVQVHLTDFILLPVVKGQFKSANINEEYNQLGSSSFDFVIHKNYSEIYGNAFDSVSGSAFIPHNSDGKFMMNMELTKLDPFKFMSLFDSKISKVGSNTELSGRIDVQAPTLKLKNINGELLLTQVYFKAERNTLNLKDSATVKIVNGSPEGEIEFLDHQDNALKLLLTKNDNHLKGSIGLGFLRTLLPNIDEIQGELELDSKFVLLPKFGFVEGKGKIKDLSLRIENLIHSFKDIFVDLNFAGENIYLSSINGLFANGQIQGEGKVFFEDGIGVDISGKVDRVNLNIPQDFRSVVSGDYYIRGVGFPYVFGGDFKVLKGNFEMEFESGNSEQYVVIPSKLLPKSRAVVSALNLDINVKSARPITVDNSYIDGDATADLRIKGSPSQPILRGQVRLLSDSKIIFQSNKFNVNSGLVVFNSVSPERGTLNIDASARIKDFVDILEREYDIRMLIQGTGSNPQISFSSQPDLTEPQILSFLAFGMLENNSLNQEISLGDQQAQTGYQLGGIFLKNKFAKDIQDRLGLQFNFTSSYENQDVSPKIVVEKKFNAKFSLSGSRTLGAFQKNTLRGEYKINRKLSIIGLYENLDLDNQATLNRARLIDGNNVLGMDLQYNVEFQ